MQPWPEQGAVLSADVVALVAGASVDADLMLFVTDVDAQLVEVQHVVAVLSRVVCGDVRSW